MFTSFSRIFRSGSGTEEVQLDVEKGEQRTPPSPPLPPLPPTRPNGMNRVPSALTLDRSRGPSQVSWITPSPSPSNLSPSNGGSTPRRASRLIGSSDELNAPKRSSGLRKSFGSESLLASSAYLTDSSNGSERPRRLSIATDQETTRFPVMRRPSLDSVPLTPDSSKTIDGNSRSGYMAFLNRPLKRTISQGSTNTFGTMASNAPSIPPIDLRPNFANSLGLPASAVRKSQFIASLPTGSPRKGQPSVIYEDDDDSSFITARSEHDSDRDSDVEFTNSEPSDIEVDIGTSVPAGPSGHSLYATTGTEHSHMSLTSGYCDYVHEIPRPGAPTPPHSSQSAHSSSLSILETISRRSQGSDTTAVEKAIERRWLQGLSFGSYKSVSKRWSVADGVYAQLTLACILFWLGFAAPWCWLIGGWYLAPSGEVKPEGQYLDCVPVWKWPRPRRRTTSGVVRPSKDDADPGKRAHKSNLWPFHAHAEETQPMSPVNGPGSGSVHSLQMLTKHVQDVPRVDPWVRRCQIAAMASGVALAIAIIVLLVVLVGVRR